MKSKALEMSILMERVGFFLPMKGLNNTLYKQEIIMNFSCTDDL